ncbi:MAG: trigger factor [Caldilineaceae bacterium]
MALTITREERENRQLVLNVEAPKERVEKELQKAAKKISSQYGVPGFRKGKAPYSMVVRTFGLANLYSEFVDNLGQEMYKAAIDQEKIEPYAMAQLEDIQMEPTLTYKLVVPLEPIIELGDYRSLRLEPDAPTIDEEQVNQRLEQYRQQYADWRDVDRPAQYGDTLSIDITSKITDEDVTVLDEKDWEVTLDEENPLEPQGLDTELLGMSVGDSKEFDIAYPAESQSVHAGKTAHFIVTINKIQAYEKPELDDALAPLVGPDFNTLEDLKANIRNSLAEVEKSRLDNEFVNKALDAVVEASKLDYPPVVVEDQIDGMVQDLSARLRQMGIDDVNWYFQQIGQTEEQFRESMRETATQIARRNLVLSEIIQKEKLNVSDEALEERIRLMTATEREDQKEQAERMAESLRSGSARQILVSQLLREAGIDRLLAIVRGEEVPEPGSETGEEGSAPAADESTEPTSEAKPDIVVVDDLTVIEGIGPVINRRLHESGVKTYANLAEASVDDLKAILVAANLNIHDPTSWPQQAKLAADGKWDELKALQEKLIGGRA